MPRLLQIRFVLAFLALVAVSAALVAADDAAPLPRGKSEVSAAGAGAADTLSTPKVVRDSVDQQLEALRTDLQRSAPIEDPFAKGLKPDLVLLSSGDVQGETGPCG